MVRGCNVTFQAGLGCGVLGSRDVTYDLPEEDFEKPMFIKELIERQDELLNELVFTEVQDMKVVE
jgi:hypothetical protein